MEEAIKYLQGLDAEWRRQLGVFQERLDRAMERERALQEENEKLQIRVQEAEAELAAMESHPQVREAKRNELAQRIAELTEQLKGIPE